MFQRDIIRALEKWLKKKGRKPLVIRGARQVGKTTAVEHFARNFKQYIYLNLEKGKDRELFEQNLSFSKTLEAIFFLKNGNPEEIQTLIFIDEIQNSSAAITMLRYFYEEVPNIPVIAAGSLLEIYLEKYRISFPVGRVEFLYLYPMRFAEYIEASGAGTAVNAFNAVPLPGYARGRLLDLFHEYILIGGMPAVVAEYLEYRDLNRLSSIYESLLVSYTDDAAKYSRNSSMFQVIRHAIETAPMEAGNRIRFHGFGNSSYRSREMGEAFRTLERAMLLYLLYPVTSTELPLIPDKKKSPRLLFLDTGLINYYVGLQKRFIGLSDLNSLYRGKIAEHIVGQELLASECSRHKKPIFWIREKAGSSAEIDFIYLYNGLAVPVEVKSGKAGTLRSLHLFMEKVNHDLAVRLYSRELVIDNLKTPGGKSFRLLNMPYFLCSKLDSYLEWMLSNGKS